jgi:MoxR-like ATPase
MPAERTREEEAERCIRRTEEALVNTRNFLDELEGRDTPAHEQIEAFAADLERRIAKLETEKATR